MSMSCAATAAAAAATKRTLDLQAVSHHAANVVADQSAAAKHQVGVAPIKSAAATSTTAVQNALLSIKQGGL